MMRFKKFEERYGRIRNWEKYFVRYKNDDYMLSIAYPVDKNKKPIPPKDPTERLEVNPVLIPLREDMPDIVIDIKKEHSTPKDYIVMTDDARNKYEMLCFCKPETAALPTWKRAYAAIKDIDRLIREMYPGYCIMDKEYPMFE